MERLIGFGSELVNRFRQRTSYPLTESIACLGLPGQDLIHVAHAFSEVTSIISFSPDNDSVAECADAVQSAHLYNRVLVEGPRALGYYSGSIFDAIVGQYCLDWLNPLELWGSVKKLIKPSGAIFMVEKKFDSEQIYQQLTEFNLSLRVEPFADNSHLISGYLV